MRFIIKRRWCLLLYVLCALAGNLNAQSVIVTEQSKVRNDTMEVLFVARALSGTPESAVQDVVTLTDWALSYRSSYAELMMSRATPQKAQYYDGKKLLIEWTASQEIKIKGDNLEQMRALVNKLVDRLHPVRVRFLLSEKKRTETEQALLNRALDRYKHEFSQQAENPRNYIRISADNLSAEANQLISDTFLKAGTLNVDFQPGFSLIKVELLEI